MDLSVLLDGGSLLLPVDLRVEVGEPMVSQDNVVMVHRHDVDVHLVFEALDGVFYIIGYLGIGGLGSICHVNVVGFLRLEGLNFEESSQVLPTEDAICTMA